MDTPFEKNVRILSDPDVFEVDYEFTWSAGRSPRYWYRVVGSMPNEASLPVDPDDPCVPNDCCQKIIETIIADSPDDLCRKLRARRWHYAIESVARYAIPAETQVAKEMYANGFDPRCLLAEEILLCEVPACAEFCIDQDIEDCWCWDDSVVLESAPRVAALSLTGLRYHDLHVRMPATGASSVRFYRNGELHQHQATFAMTLRSRTTHMINVHVRRLRCNLRVKGSFKVKSSFYVIKMTESRVETLRPITHSVKSIDAGDRSWVVGDNYGVSLGQTGRSAALDLTFPPIKSRITYGELVLNRSAVGMVRDGMVQVNLGKSSSLDLAKDRITWPVGIPQETRYEIATPIRSESLGVRLVMVGMTASPQISATIHDVKLVVTCVPRESTGITLHSRTTVRAEYYHHQFVMRLPLQFQTLLRHHIKHHSRVRCTLSGGQVSRIHHRTSGLINLNCQFGVLSSFYKHRSVVNLRALGSSVFASPIMRRKSIALADLKSDTAITLAFVKSTSIHTRIGFMSKYRFAANVNLDAKLNVISSTCVRSTHMSHFMSGLVKLGVRTHANAGKLGDVMIPVALSPMAEAQDVVVNYSHQVQSQALRLVEFGGAGVEVPMRRPDRTAVSCLCDGIPLLLPMATNIHRTNKLNEFIKRNSINSQGTFRLRHVPHSHSWNLTTRHQGYGATSSQQELWTLHYELRCVNEIAGDLLDKPIWRFGLRVTKRSFVMNKTLDTRITVGFLPDTICHGSSGLMVDINVDVMRETMWTSPPSTLYQTSFHDRLGLFKSDYWRKNPVLSFSISSPGIAEYPGRLPIDLGVHK